MAATESGYVVSVDLEPIGSGLTNAAAVGATSITVDDPTPFDESGGTLMLNGTTYAYSTVDPVANVVTFASGVTLAAAANAGDLAQDYDTTLGAVTTQTVAQVQVGDPDAGGDTVEAIVSAAVVPILPVGQRGTNGESVTLEQDGLQWILTNVIGQQPVINGQAFLDPTTLGAIAAAQASADGKNTITYSPATPDATTPGNPGDTWFVFSAGPPATITAQYDCTAGTGTDSGNTWVSVQITSDVIANLDAGKITTGTLSAVEIDGVTITGSLFETASSGLRTYISKATSTTDGANLSSIWFSSGLSSETTPARVSLGWNGDDPPDSTTTEIALILLAPVFSDTPAYTAPPSITLEQDTGSDTSNYVTVTTDIFSVADATHGTTHLEVSTAGVCVGGGTALNGLQIGTATMGAIAANDTITVTVTFPTAFTTSSPPTVFCSQNESSWITTNSVNATGSAGNWTGFSVVCRNLNSSASTAGTLNWLAIR